VRVGGSTGAPNLDQLVVCREDDGTSLALALLFAEPANTGPLLQLVELLSIRGGQRRALSDEHRGHGVPHVVEPGIR
jgi:hypothetical protein